MRATIATLAHDAARAFSEKRAVSVSGDKALSFAEIDRLAGRAAGKLMALGLRAGHRVILHLPNGWRWIIAYHALARMGAVVVPANILLSAAEISFIAADCEANAIILPGDRASKVDVGEALVVTDDGTAGTPFDALLDGEWLEPLACRPDDLFTIGYTSGTTGKPKGAMLSHGNIFASVSHTATIHVRTRHDRVYSALPLPHVYGNVVMNSCFLTGASLFLAERFDAGAALKAIEQERITLFEGVPTMYYQLLAHPALEGADLSSLTRCTVGGQTMPVSKLDAVAERFGCPILELWGMTEVGGPATSHSPWWPPRHGSIGLPFPGTELRIAAADCSQDAPTGEPGELMVRGSLVTSGYWRNKAATSSAIDADGWLATGDVAYRDDEGYYFIVDRKKDMILTAGYNVYPAELEQVIARFEGVSMVAVVGMADEEKGEVAHAFVVPEPGTVPDEASLIAYCREHLAAYKIPRAVHFVDDLPKTSTGKILRRALRDRSEQTQ